MSFNMDKLSTVIDIDSALKRVCGNIELLEKLLIVMKNKYENSHEEVMNLINNNDIDEAILLVHTIKGAAGNLSITELYTSALNLEVGLKEKSDNIKKLLEVFKESIDNTLKAI